MKIDGEKLGFGILYFILGNYSFMYSLKEDSVGLSIIFLLTTIVVFSLAINRFKEAFK